MKVDLKEIEKVLKKTEFSIDDYKKITNRMQDDKSKNTFFYRIMLDCTNDAYYGLMMEKEMFYQDKLNSIEDKTMYEHLKFLLKNHNYKKKIYILGFSSHYDIPNCDVWQSWKPLDVVCIFDDISEDNIYSFDATGGKYINVYPLNYIYNFDFENSIIIVGNKDYSYLIDELIHLSKIRREDVFIVLTETIGEKNIQYFAEPFLNFSNDEIFIDGGAYDLQSSLSFCWWVYGMYEKVYAFEPIEEYYNLCKNIVEECDLSNIEVYNIGLSNGSRIAKYDNLGSASRESVNGLISVQTNSIDNILNGNRASVIKLDIEGAEYEAIEGAKETIIKYKPILMICVYHKPNDAIRLAKLILSYNKNYKIYLRHYGYRIYETVMYFIDDHLAI